MNQILYTTNQRKEKEPLEIKVVLRIFAILCILFGAIIAGQASFAMLTQKEEMSQSVPLVEINSNGDSLLIKVKHDKIIDNIVYYWNESQEVVLQGKGRMELEEMIDMPEGINTLVLKVTDIAGKTVSYSEVYEKAEGDTIKPEIELLVESSKVKIVAKDETQLDYIVYYWNEEDETRIEARSYSPKQIEEKIDILKGENTLTIIAVDKAGNEATKEQTFKAVKKPIITLARDGKELIIKVTDEEEIQKIEYTLNGVYYSTDPSNTGNSLHTKEFEFRQPLQEGENKITIKAYNISGLETEVSGEATI